MQTKRPRRFQLFQKDETSHLVHRIIAVILLTAVVLANPLAVINVTAQGGAVVKVDPASSAVTVGGTVVVNIRIENVTNMAGAEVHLTYDSSLLALQQIQAGGFPAPDFVAQSNASGGQIDYAIAQMPAQHQPVSGSGTLLQITFKGLAAGSALLHITSAVLSDAAATLIPSTTQDGTVIVSSTSATTSPVPTSPAPTSAPVPTSSPAATPIPGSATVRVVPASAPVSGVAVVAVRIENATNLWGADLKVTYDPNAVQCTQSQVGSLPVPDVVAKNTCAAGAAEYIVTQQSPRAPSSGSGTAVQLTFTCLKSGTFALHLDRSSLVNKDGLALPKVAVDGTVSCGTTTTGRIHTVMQGETLYCIGRAYSVSPWAISSQNGVPWPYTIYVGQQLYIPNVPWYNIPPGPVCVAQFSPGPVPTPAPTAIPGATATPTPGCVQSYMIQPGDTLIGIAARFGVDLYTLAARNYILNLNLIFAYTTICIR